MLMVYVVSSYIPSRRQLSGIVVLLAAASGLPLKRQPELMLQLEVVFSFLSSARQISAIVALLITASSFCLDIQQELVLIAFYLTRDTY